jgi:hypothetical protein
MSGRPVPHLADSTCSAASARLLEPLAGTAPTATGWLAIEQPGPWGARALAESGFDRELGRELSARAAAVGVRIALIRRPGHHALTDRAASHQVFYADTRPGRSVLYSRTLAAADLPELLDALPDGAVQGSALTGAVSNGAVWRDGDVHPGPVLLVCTNGKRDRCCAVLGRALALDLKELAKDTADAAAGPGPDSIEIEVWETDHLGGHRFAPTAVVLPSGYMYGRLTAPVALETARAAARGQVVTELCRGRSTWSRPGQAADLALRAELQDFDPDSVQIRAEQQISDHQWVVEAVVPGNGGSYLVHVESAPAAEPRPESCGKAFGNPPELTVTAVEKR